MTKLYEFKIRISSTNVYETTLVAENEDKAIDYFITGLDDTHKMSEGDFEVDDIENLGEHQNVCDWF